MYRVILVDDEVAAIEYIQGIIESKCTGFEVVGTAKSGEKCLEVFERSGADVIITDIKMAGIGGMELIEEIRRRNRDIQLIIVSGYSEFEYAKKAITNQVFEYILKPVDPEEFTNIMVRLFQMLENLELSEKKQLFKDLCQGIAVEKEKLKRFFGNEEYYAFLLRRNHLPAQFRDNKNAEVVTNIYGSYFLYARDEEEAFYLLPKSCLNSKRELKLIIKKCSEKFYQEQGFLTIVEIPRAFGIDMMTTSIGEVYKTLQQCLICGISQNIVLREQQEPVDINEEEQDRIQKIVFYLSKKQYNKAKAELKILCLSFEKRRVVQVQVETAIKKICRCSYYNNDSEYLLNEILYHSLSIEELFQNICDFLFKEEKEGGKLDTPEYFESVCQFVESHLAEHVSLHSIVNEFHVSQSHLSYIFRKYANQSFNMYLTSKRIEKAKQILMRDPDILIKDVALMVGFRDQFYFSRVFKMYTNVRPTEYGSKNDG